METSFHSPTAQGRRVFRGAWVVLGLVALAQGAAVAVAWKDRAPLDTPLSPEVAATPPAAVEVDPFDPSTQVMDDPHPELAGDAGVDPLLPDPAEPVLARPPVVVAAPLDEPISDEACLKHLDEGIYLRDRGDMQGAVKELRQALEVLPDHPKLLYQLALTLDGMSLERKAAEHWRKLRLLGKGAGNYYQLAVERLKEGGSLPVPGEAAGEAEEEKEGRFVVGDVSVERLPEAAGEEVLMIGGRIVRKQTEDAEVPKIGIKLHLFDEVNGQRIDRIFGAEPPIQWLDEPVDWKDGSERFLYTFRRPPLSPEELVKMGQLKYYGYAVELRYGDSEKFEELKLQDVVAEPAFLADMARELPEGGPVPPGPGSMDVLTPPSAPGQPDAVLFPGDRFDR